MCFLVRFIRSVRLFLVPLIFFHPSELITPAEIVNTSKRKDCKSEVSKFSSEPPESWIRGGDL